MIHDIYINVLITKSKFIQLKILYGDTLLQKRRLSSDM